jgi:tetratricopeptide (TPR) repeat protein
VAAADGVVKILETTGGSELLSLRTGEAGVCRLDWSPNGQRIAAASDQMIRIWDASRGFEFADNGARQSELAWIYSQQAVKDPSLRAQALERSLQAAPKRQEFRALRGRALAGLGRFDEAAREFRAARPNKIEQGLFFADEQLYAYLGARDLDSYRGLLKEFVPAMERTNIDYNREEAYWLASLIPNSGIDLTSYVEEQRKAIAADERSLDDVGLVRWAAALARQGKFTECAQILTRAGDEDYHLMPREKYVDALSMMFDAMARQQLGHQKQASRLLKNAALAHAQIAADPEASWKWLVELDAVRREAEPLIDVDP